MRIARKKSARKTNEKQGGRKYEDAEHPSPAMMQLLLQMMGALSNVRTTLLDFVFQLGLRSVAVLLEQERTTPKLLIIDE